MHSTTSRSSPTQRVLAWPASRRSRSRSIAFLRTRWSATSFISRPRRRCLRRRACAGTSPLTASVCCSTRRGRRSTRGSASCRRSRRHCGRPSPPHFRGLVVDVAIFEEPKIDCHVHVFDPARFPYGANTHYAPTAQEIGMPTQLAQVMAAYGTRYALLVGPNSGYGLDNACMLDTIARGAGRYKGIAVVANDATSDQLQALKRAGVVGVAWNR